MRPQKAHHVGALGPFFSKSFVWVHVETTQIFSVLSFLSAWRLFSPVWLVDDHVPTVSRGSFCMVFPVLHRDSHVVAVVMQSCCQQPSRRCCGRLVARRPFPWSASARYQGCVISGCHQTIHNQLTTLPWQRTHFRGSEKK